MATYPFSVRPSPLLSLPVPEQISTRLRAGQQAPGVATSLLGTYPTRCGRRCACTSRTTRSCSRSDRECDPERVRADVVIPMRAGRDVGSLYTVRWVALTIQPKKANNEQWNEWSHRPLLIKTERHITISINGLHLFSLWQDSGIPKKPFDFVCLSP